MPAAIPKLAVLLVIPLLAFMVLPVATVHAVTPNAEVGVSCDSDSSVQTGASVTFAGHSVVVLCSPGAEHEVNVCFVLSASGKFAATMTAGGLSFTHKGTYATSSGGYIEGYLYAPQDGESYATWWVASYCS
jgi:hypothetical protein